MANFYRIGAAGLNWKNTGSWSSTSGGASNGVDEPSASDAVLFDTNSPTSVTVAANGVGSTLSLTKSGLTITLNGGSLTITNAITIATNAQVINKTAAETVSCGGFVANTSITGTAKIIITGGTWSGSNTTGIANDLDLQGTITISGNVYYRTGTLTYVSGTITVTSSTLNLTSSCTLIGGTYNNITLSNTTALTYTINTTTVTANGTLTIGAGATTTFAGTAGFTCATLLCDNTAATTVNFKELITYTITTLFSCYKSRLGSIVLFTSSHASTKANILMPNNGNNSCNILASFTRIDASGGRTIMTYGGTLTDCTNIKSYTDKDNYASSMAA